jgi:hypothetical protein
MITGLQDGILASPDGLVYGYKLWDFLFCPQHESKSWEST